MNLMWSTSLQASGRHLIGPILLPPEPQPVLPSLLTLSMTWPPTPPLPEPSATGHCHTLERTGGHQQCRTSQRGHQSARSLHNKNHRPRCTIYDPLRQVEIVYTEPCEAPFEIWLGHSPPPWKVSRRARHKSRLAEFPCTASLHTSSCEGGFCSLAC